LHKESDMRTKHQITKVSTSEKKSTVKNLAKRISELKTMEKKKLGEFKTGKNMVNLDANDDASEDEGEIV